MELDLARLGERPSRMSEEVFVEAFGGIYENSEWVAHRAWQQGLSEAQDTVKGLAQVLRAIVDATDPDTRLALIRAHPDLAGRAALRGELTESSSREQAGAGIDQCSEKEFERFHAMNEAYQDKFGFPFVMAVKGSNRRAILAAFEERLDNDRATEFERAITEIHRIARLRLEELAAARN